MVEISEFVDTPSPAQDRLLDAEEIEKVLSHLQRPTARMQLEALAKKLRKESEALSRLEASRQTAANEEERPVVEDVTASKPPPPQPVSLAHPPAAVSATAKYVPIDTFAFDAGSYSSSTVTVYVSLDGVKGIPRENIKCDFTPGSFDLIVKDLGGKNYRLFKDNLAHDIDPESSKIIVKVDRIVIKLGKVKGEYGFDTWTDLIDKKKRKVERDADGKRKKEDPHSSIMNLMKEMYESGDDNMRKVIGETMEKQRRGELGKDGGMGGGLDDF
jgi:calcyclin binding protein